MRLATLPTPLVRAKGLESALSAGPIYLKRDDLTGFGIAGNKARALEFLIGEAVDQQADVLVAAGSPSSNFCAAAAMAARTAGLACDLLFSGPPPAAPSVNIELARACGALLYFDAAATREQLDDAVLDHAKRLQAQGRRPYAVPRGGATGVGAAGYACAAWELADQCAASGITPAVVVVATATGCGRSAPELVHAASETAASIPSTTPARTVFIGTPVVGRRRRATPARPRRSRRATRGRQSRPTGCARCAR
jgi:D-cysteine desulfhydrase